MLKELNSYQIDQYAVSAYSSSGTNHEHWAAMRIAKLNLCQLDAPIKFGLKMEGFQDCLDSENNDDNECYQSTSPGMKFSETLLIAVSFSEISMHVVLILYHITIIILRHILHLCLCLGLGRFMSFLCDLIFYFQPHFQCH